MTTKPLLTIVIPTYNRARYLDLLFGTLYTELQGIEDKVNIIVGDNASPDNTSKITEKYKALIANCIVLRHATNTGEENFAICVEQVKTPYFWMIGDDDLPKTGVLRQIVAFLESEEIDLLYLNSEWMPNIASSDDGTQLTSGLKTKKVTGTEFARQVNVRVTFISGMVVNLKRLRELQPGIDIKRFNNTSFIHLGWVLQLLMSGQHFKIISQHAVLATSGNTGGYKLFQAFGENLPRILGEVCGKNSREYKYIIRVLYWKYLPALIWSTRFKRVGDFESEDILKALVGMKRSLAYWLIVPMLRFSKITVSLFYFPVRLAAKFIFLIA